MYPTISAFCQHWQKDRYAAPVFVPSPLEIGYLRPIILSLPLPVLPRTPCSHPFTVGLFLDRGATTSICWMNAAIALRPIRQTGNSELWVATAPELLPLRARKGSQNGGRVVQKARWYHTRWGITTIVIIIILIIGVVVGSVVSSTWRHT